MKEFFVRVLVCHLARLGRHLSTVCIRRQQLGSPNFYWQQRCGRQRQRSSRSSSGSHANCLWYPSQIAPGIEPHVPVVIYPVSSECPPATLFQPSGLPCQPSLRVRANFAPQFFCSFARVLCYFLSWPFSILPSRPSRCRSFRMS
jgi:hypothetical protein